MISYVHDLNPVLISFGDLIALRWYGLSYVLGFIAAYYYLQWLSRKKLWELPESKVGDFITIIAIFGVLLGGRLGYIFFYYIRAQGWDAFLDDPLIIFKTWQGGMASHGGLIGMILCSLYYAKKHKVSWLSLLDGLALAAPIGIFFGRIANFINGELYGRVTQGLTWGMKFPQELWEKPILARDVYHLLAQQNSSITPASNQTLTAPDIQKLIDLNRSEPEVTQALNDILPERHPSQLYEALAEGLILFLILSAVRIIFPKLGNGFIAGLFCLIYAGGRIFVECYREPDAQLVGSMTMGQFLSLFLIIIGLAFITSSLTNKNKARI